MVQKIDILIFFSTSALLSIFKPFSKEKGEDSEKHLKMHLPVFLCHHIDPRFLFSSYGGFRDLTEIIKFVVKLL